MHSPAAPRPLARPLAALIVASTVGLAGAAPEDAAALGPADRETLRRYALDTWRSFEAMARAGGLPADGLRIGGDGAWRPTEKTTPTDVAAYLWSTLAAERLGIAGADEAGRRLGRTLEAL